MNSIANSAPRRKLPAYGRILAQRIAENNPPLELVIYDRLKRFDANSQLANPQFVRLCYPEGEPGDYDWALVRGFECLIFCDRLSPREAASLALELLLSGASVVRIPNVGGITVYGANHE